jgi:hypothetical protein
MNACAFGNLDCLRRGYFGQDHIETTLPKRRAQHSLAHYLTRSAASQPVPPYEATAINFNTLLNHIILPEISCGGVGVQNPHTFYQRNAL